MPVENSISPVTPASRFWQQLKPDKPTSVLSRSLFVASLSTMNHTPLVDLIQQRQIQLKDMTQAALLMVIVDTLGDPRLASFNAMSLKNKIPLLVLKPVGLVFEYALFTGESACWACFEKRHRLLDGPATYLYNVTKPEHPITPPASYTDTSLALVYHWVLMEIEHLSKGSVMSRLQGKLHTLRFDDMKTSRHQITKLSNCPACGVDNGPSEHFPDPPNIDQHHRFIS